MKNQHRVTLGFTVRGVNSEIPPASDKGRCHHPGDHSILAKETVVPALGQSGTRRSDSSTSQEQPADSGQLHSPASRDTGLEGLEIERRRLGDLGCSQEVIQTLLLARKSSTNTTYYRLWKKFVALAESSQFNPLFPEVHNILA